jgi:hypothetical protein
MTTSTTQASDAVLVRSQRDAGVAQPSSLERLFSPALTRILEAPESLEIFLLNPEPEQDDNPALFHRHRVCGVAQIRATEARQEVGRALIEANRSDAKQAFCFDPHYGVRASRGSEMADLLICFPCGNVCVEGIGDAGGMYPIGAAAEKLLRQKLRAAGVGWLWFWRRWLG